MTYSAVVSTMSDRPTLTRQSTLGAAFDLAPRVEPPHTGADGPLHIVPTTSSNLKYLEGLQQAPVHDEGLVEVDHRSSSQVSKDCLVDLTGLVADHAEEEENL